MTTRSRKAWAKIRHALYTDERALELSGIALALRVTFTVWALEDGAQRLAGRPAPGVGWLMTEDGDPYTLRRLARLARFDEQLVEQALQELVDARVVVRSDAGAWGVVGWSAGQEDPSAARVRAHRERQRGPLSAPVGSADETPVARYSNGPETAEERGERRELTTPLAAPARVAQPVPTPTLGERIRQVRERWAWSLPAAAKRAEIGRGLLANIEADEVLPTPAQLAALAAAYGDPELATIPLPERDEDLVAGVVRQHHEHRAALGLADPDDRPTVTAHAVAAVYAAADSDLAAGRDLAATWRTVLARAAEELRREFSRGNRDGARYFELALLAREKRREKFVAAIDLDRRDDSPPVRGSPRRRGPPPPQNDDPLPLEIQDVES